MRILHSSLLEEFIFTKLFLMSVAVYGTANFILTGRRLEAGIGSNK